jgi:hypothetical protein
MVSSETLTWNDQALGTSCIETSPFLPQTIGTRSLPVVLCRMVFRAAPLIQTPNNISRVTA